MEDFSVELKIRITCRSPPIHRIIHRATSFPGVLLKHGKNRYARMTRILRRFVGERPWLYLRFEIAGHRGAFDVLRSSPNRCC